MYINAIFNSAHQQCANVFDIASETLSKCLFYCVKLCY